MIALAVIAFVVGVLIGCVGIGGILLIPAISAFTGMETRQAMATALFSFVFTALLGTWLFARRGSIDWKTASPICLGSLVFGYLGALANSRVNPVVLNIALSITIVFAGVYVLLPAKPNRGKAQSDRQGRGLPLLFGIGSAVGFASGLTGVGGPVLSVPLMIVLGFSPLTAIATGQIIQVAAASSGTVGNLLHGAVDFRSAAWLTVVQLAGLALGVRLAHSFNAQRLRKLVAAVCLLVGGFLFLRSTTLLLGLQ
jgi:uncharacterized membrane protein YfcA